MNDQTDHPNLVPDGEYLEHVGQFRQSHVDAVQAPVMLTATFTVTIAVERDKWAAANDRDCPSADDFWAYLGDGSDLAEALRDDMGSLRDADGTVTMTPQARSVARDVTDAEPPVGSTFYQGDRLVWARRDDGWHCARPIGACRNCPCGWDEVRDIGGIQRPDVELRWPT
jgi:hypothetical protein